MGNKVIPREVKRITYSTEIRGMKNIPLTDLQRAVIIGNILGDGCLCENWSKTNYRLKVNHSVKQKEYVFWKYEVLKNIVLTEPKVYEPTQAMIFRTISHPELTVLRTMFYRGRQKIIPNNIEKLLKDPIVLAVWFMDDGNIVKKDDKVVGFHLNTQSFTKDENQDLRYILFKLYGIHTNLEKNKNKYRLAIWRKPSRDLFESLVKKHLVPSMQYKIG